MRISVKWFAPISLMMAITAGASTRELLGSVHRTLPPFRFTIYEVGEGDGSKQITSIEIHSAERLVQTIRFDDDGNAPIDFAPGDPLTLQDVDCDGYKDLLVRNLVGVHGDAWYRLFRFDSSNRRFVEYGPFKDLAYKSVDCSTKLLKTYVNSGAAGCIYEAGWYHWVNQVLLPVRIESQDGGDNGSFIRTIRLWRNGKEMVLSKNSVPVDNCHLPNGTTGEPRK
jgi:hypothetical protein